MNEIAKIEQLPVITERMKEIGQNLKKRLSDLKLESLVCNEDTRKDMKQLKAELGKEFKAFEEQRKNIKTTIMNPYEEFYQDYLKEIKEQYDEADNILATKINEVETEIKNETLRKMQEYFNEYKTSKALIKDDYLFFEDLGMTVGLNLLTDKGMLVKKVKDEIIAKVDGVESDLQTISTLDYNDEVLVEYLKTKNLGQAIRDVNDRHVILDTIKQANEENEKVIEQDMKVIEQVDEVLQAPVEEDMIDGQMTIEDVIPEDKKEEIYEMAFEVRTNSYEKLKRLVEFMKTEGIEYEPITD